MMLTLDEVQRSQPQPWMRDADLALISKLARCAAFMTPTENGVFGSLQHDLLDGTISSMTAEFRKWATEILGRQS